MPPARGASAPTTAGGPTAAAVRTPSPSGFVPASLFNLFIDLPIYLRDHGDRSFESRGQVIDLFPKDENRETEVSHRGFRFLHSHWDRFCLNGYDFLSKSQQKHLLYSLNSVVNAGAKILIFKQITTDYLKT